MDNLRQKQGFENQHTKQKIYLRDLNSLDDETPVHSGLVELKQINQQCYNLQDILTKIENVEANAHFEAMRKQSENLYKIVSKSALINKWMNLSNLEINSDSDLFLNEMTSRKNDLLADIKNFYRMGQKICKKYVEYFKKFHKLSLSYNHSVHKFCVYVENMMEKMIDLDERIAVLTIKIDPNSRGLNVCRMSTNAQTKIIVKRSREILTLFKSNHAGKSEYLEIFRLNRRMIVVLQEADFLKLSKTNENRYEIIKEIVIYTAEYHDKDEEDHQDPLVEIMLKMDNFKEKVVKDCNAFLKKCSDKNMIFQNLVLMRNPKNYCSSQNEKMAMDFMNCFEEIAERFDVFNDECNDIKNLLDDAFRMK